MKPKVLEGHGVVLMANQVDCNYDVAVVADVKGVDELPEDYVRRQQADSVDLTMGSRCGRSY